MKNLHLNSNNQAKLWKRREKWKKTVKSNPEPEYVITNPRIVGCVSLESSRDSHDKFSSENNGNKPEESETTRDTKSIGTNPTTENPDIWTGFEDISFDDFDQKKPSKTAKKKLKRKQNKLKLSK